MGKGIVRSITYTYDYKNVIRRRLGAKMTIDTPDGPKEVSVSKIILDTKEQIPTYDIYVSNEINEIAYWKTVSALNIEVEYELAETISYN